MVCINSLLSRRQFLLLYRCFDFFPSQYIVWIHLIVIDPIIKFPLLGLCQIRVSLLGCNTVPDCLYKTNSIFNAEGCNFIQRSCDVHAEQRKWKSRRYISNIADRVLPIMRSPFGHWQSQSLFYLIISTFIMSLLTSYNYLIVLMNW